MIGTDNRMHLLDFWPWPRPRAPSLKLRVHAALDKASTCWIHEFPALLGRGEEADVYIPDRLVSRTHCLIRRVGDEVVLRDLGSRHGTFVNGLRVSQKSLAVGDEIWMGTTKLVVVMLVAQ